MLEDRAQLRGMRHEVVRAGLHQFAPIFTYTQAAQESRGGLAHATELVDTAFRMVLSGPPIRGQTPPV